MKTKFFVIAFSLVTLVAGAQITITQNDLPSIGTIVGFVSDTTPVSASPGAAGANQTWNLSVLLPEDSGGYSFIDPVTAAGGSNFPTSNLAIPDSANTGATFFKKTAASFDLYGAYSDFGYGPMALKFNPVEPWLTFPSTYQTTFNGTAKYQITVPYSNPPIDSVKIVSTTIYNSVIDGWGTITTPDFTGISVLRQKFTEIIIDSTFAHYYSVWVAVGTPTVDTVITYRWWSNDAKLYIAEMVSNPAGVVSKGTYLIDMSPYCTLIASAAGTNETGLGYNNGTATATASGGITPYFYSWSNGETTSSINNLVPGTYFVTISDAINCTVVDTVVVDPYLCSFSISVSATDELSFNGNNGTATATATGGTTPFSYSWSNGGSAATITGLAPGSYSVLVTDNKGCYDSDTVIVNAYVCAFSVFATATGELSYSGNNGTASVTTTGGNNPLAYSWSNGGVTPTITGLAPGVYTVTVTDNNNCSGSDSATVAAYTCALSVTAYAGNESSYNGNNGAATVSVSGGNTPYSYVWSNGGNTATITGLSPGSYSIIVSDSGGCVSSDTVIVNAYICTLSLTASSTNESTAGANDGTAIASGNGGTPPYSYVWSNNDSTASVSNLSPGVYSVTVTDSADCVKSATVIVNGGGCTLVIDSLVAADILCQGSNTGSLSVFCSGGTTPYSYDWSNGSILSQLTNIPSQNYSVIISDGGSCFADTSHFISEPPALSLSMSSTSVLCNGGLDGTATASPAGGTSPYSYQWCSCAGNQTTQTAVGLTSGTFYVTITDGNGCTKNSTVVVNQPAALVLFLSSNGANCYGSCDGSAMANVVGGTSPYTYFWSNGDGLANSDSLCAGNYYISVSDLNGCSQNDSVTINQAAPLLVTLNYPTWVVCEGDTSSISVTVSGGNSPYTYLWSNGETGQSIIVSSSQVYTVTISDASGCFEIISGSHPFNSNPVLSMAQTNILCNGNCDGTTTPAVTGGVSPFVFMWDNPCLSCPLFTDICPGTYTYTVADANGCSATSTVTLMQPDAIGVSLSYGNASCFNECDGSASVTVSGGTTPYSYLWSPQPGTGQGTENASQICAGNDTLIVTDGNNCALETSFFVAEPTALVLSLTATPDSGTSNGTATVIYAGGGAPYTFLWTGGQTATTATGLSSGIYVVTVTDANGCTETDSVEVALFVGTYHLSPLTSRLSVYPNPVNNNLNLQLSFASSEKIEIVLINALGEETVLLNRIIEKGEREFSFDTENLASGVYFLRISVSGSKPGYKRFVKM